MFGAGCVGAAGFVEGAFPAGRNAVLAADITDAAFDWNSDRSDTDAGFGGNSGAVLA